MSAHTPGPWRARMVEPQEWAIDATAGDPVLGFGRWDGLASVYGCDDEPGQGARSAKANADLVAAAPELLEALRPMVEGTAWLTEAHVAAARAAIAKATGA